MRLCVCNSLFVAFPSICRYLWMFYRSVAIQLCTRLRTLCMSLRPLLSSRTPPLNTPGFISIDHSRFLTILLLASLLSSPLLSLPSLSLALSSVICLSVCLCVSLCRLVGLCPALYTSLFALCRSYPYQSTLSLPPSTFSLQLSRYISVCIAF